VTLQEIFGTGTVLVVVILSMIEVSKIKINPWSWLAKQIGNAINGEVLKEVKELKTDIQEVKAEATSLKDDLSKLNDKVDENSAMTARVRILRFGGELSRGIDHNKENFDQALCDISDYEKYCSEHPEFKNDRAKLTIKYIEQEYNKRLENNSFL
jgi:uncharacterized coiled-coil DUF342 family protein